MVKAQNISFFKDFQAHFSQNPSTFQGLEGGMDMRIFFNIYFLLREIFLLLREGGDCMKLRESPAENGRVGISVHTTHDKLRF